MSNHALKVRQAIITRLRQVVPAAGVGMSALSIYGEESPPDPAWPFIRYGLPSETIYEASGWGVGSEQDVTIHAFARGPGMDNVTALAAAVVAALDNSQLAVEPLGLLGIDWTETTYLRDTPEASDYHAVIRFTVGTLED